MLPIFTLCIPCTQYVAIILAMSISVGVSCGQPASPSNGRVDTSAGTSFGDVVRYACDKGYTLIGVVERTCQADKRWNGNTPKCESETVECNVNSCLLNSCRAASCLFMLCSPKAFSVANLQFYHFCIGVSCGQPGVPSNGRVNSTDGVLFGDVVRYSCDAGYMVSGLAERTCQAEKRWSGNVPTCESEISIHCECTYFRFVYVTACMFKLFYCLYTH